VIAQVASGFGSGLLLGAMAGLGIAGIIWFVVTIVDYVRGNR
jgi:hypothetical protein